MVLGLAHYCCDWFPRLLVLALGLSVVDIPASADPAVRFALEQLPRRRDYHGPNTWWRIEAGAGLGQDTLRHWLYQKHKHGPAISTVRRVLNALGYDLAIIPLSREDAY